MPAKSLTIFLLWGYRCDVVAAVTYISVLRRLGLRVQIVTSAIHCLEGDYGVRIQPDLLLDEALLQAKRAICVILPFDGPSLRRLSAEETFKRFLSTAYMGGALIVTQEETASVLVSLLEPSQLDADSQSASQNQKIITYLAGDDLKKISNQLALQLLARVAKQQ